MILDALTKSATVELVIARRSTVTGKCVTSRYRKLYNNGFCEYRLHTDGAWSTSCFYKYGYKTAKSLLRVMRRYDEKRRFVHKLKVGGKIVYKTEHKA